MQPNEAREVAKSRAKNTVLPSERKPHANHAPHAARPTAGHTAHDDVRYADESHNPNVPAAKRTRAAKNNDSFLVQFRVPAKYEFSATMAALMARSNGEFELGNRRDPKAAYLEHLLYQMLDEMLEDFPAVKGKK